MIKMQTIRKQSVLKQVRENGEWIGYISPNKVNEYHVNNGWNIGCSLTIVNGKRNGLDDKPYVFSEWSETFTELEDFLNAYSFANCNNELGNRIKFWNN
jgi:hypothetical protein